MKNLGKIISVSLFALSLAMFGILTINRHAESADEQQELTGTKTPAGAVIDAPAQPSAAPVAKKEGEPPSGLPGKEGKNPFRVVSTKPSQNIKDHSPLEKSVVINFSEPLDRESFEGAVSASLASKFNVVIGEDKSTQAVITFLGAIPASADVSMIVAKSVKNRSGAELGSSFTLHFKTSPFKVAASWPKDGERNVLPKAYPYIFFNAAADKPSAEKAIKINPELKFEPVWREDTNGVPYCVLKHAEPFKPNTKYVLSVDNTALDLWGKALNATFTAVFTTEDAQ